jgi:hypothetical protein
MKFKGSAGLVLDPSAAEFEDQLGLRAGCFPLAASTSSVL